MGLGERNAIAFVFDWIAVRYDHVNRPDVRQHLERVVVVLAAGGFVLHLLLILLVRQFPEIALGPLDALDRNFLHAVYTPFSFILFYEVLMLVLALPQSHTSSIGKQYEIISLIVVRRVFKDIGGFRDMSSWLTQATTTRAVLIDMAAAAGMFLVVAIFYRIRKSVVKSDRHRDLAGFIKLKKVIAVLLCGVLLASASYSIVAWIGSTGPRVQSRPLDLDAFFFPAFFEFMIFTDVLLLIVSICYYERYEYVFRNAGFVISTVLLRFSLSTPKPLDVGLGLLAMLYGLVVLAIFAFFTRGSQPELEATWNLAEPKSKGISISSVTASDRESRNPGSGGVAG